jgi:nitroimidazol reductase NimA-like FMN-containing flavoprotein (pyridoxamine 5'-phosphate oxidase superfamily)
MPEDDRYGTDWNDGVAILKNCAAVCVALKDGEKPYAVPLSFGYRKEEGSLTLYFQISSCGRTAELLRKNPEISFTAEHLLTPEHTGIPRPQLPKYEIVFGEGRAAFVEEYGQKLKALGIFMRRYGYNGVLAYNPAAFSRSALVEVQVTRLSTGPKLIGGD